MILYWFFGSLFLLCINCANCQFDFPCTSNADTLICSNIKLPFNLHPNFHEYNRLKVIQSQIETIDKSFYFEGFEEYTVFDLENIELKEINLGAFDKSLKIQELYLSRNLLSSINTDIFATLTNLSFLDLSRNNILEIKSRFTNKKLQYLNLSRNKIQNLLESIAQLVSLESLDMSYNELTVLDLNNLPTNLQSAIFSFNNLTDVIGCNKINCFDPKVLDLSYNNLSILEPNLFHSFNNLESLLLEQNRIVNIDDDTLATVSNLKHLDLSHNLIETVRSGLFKTQRMLEVIDLSNNLITFIDGYNFVNLYNIQKIYLNNNKLDSLDILYLQDKKLQYINMDDNKFYCDELESLFKELLDLGVNVAQGRHKNTPNILGNCCIYRVVKAKEYKSNIRPIVFGVLAIFAFLAVVFFIIKCIICKPKPRSEEIQLM